MTQQRQATAEIPPEDLAQAIPGDPEQSVYRFICVVAVRARQLQSGARPKLYMPSRKVTKVAMEEVQRGLIPFVDPETVLPEEEEVTEFEGEGP